MSLYEILEVSVDAELEVIKVSYQRLRSIHHPDKGGDAEIFKEIQKAWEVLSDPQKRAEYDSTGRVGEDKTQADEMAAQIIFSIIEQTDGESVDIVHIAKQHVSQANQQLRLQQERLRRLITLNEKSLKRLKREGGLGILEMMINQRVAQYQHQLGEAIDQVALNEEVLKSLENFSFEVSSPMGHWTTTSTYTGF